jgi:hypothetical protein
LTDTNNNQAQADEQEQRVMPTQEENTLPDNGETEQAASPTEEVSESGGDQSRGELPEGVTDRTREQFDKLKRSNEALKEELDKLSASQRKSVLGSLAPNQTSTGQVGQQFVDPITGEVDIVSLNKAITDAQQQAIAARREAQKIKESTQEKEAYADYPGLNPRAKNFDKGLYQKTRAILLDSMINQGDYGHELTLKEAADLASGQDNAKVQAAEERGAKKALNELTPKEQASLEAEGRSDRRQTVADMDTLRVRSRQGDSNAIVERLKKIK